MFNEILKFPNIADFKPIFCENIELGEVQKCANLVELEKCCQPPDFLAEVRFDTAEKEPAKNL